MPEERAGTTVGEAGACTAPSEGNRDVNVDGGGVGGEGGGEEGACKAHSGGKEGGAGEGRAGVDKAFLAFDHVYRGSGSFSPALTAILYGTVGSPAMMGFHRALKAAAETGTVRYVFRHALPYGDGSGDSGGGGGGGETTPLQGYGVVLDVKNMEYQNFDSSAPDAEEVSGVFFRCCFLFFPAPPSPDPVLWQ